MVLQSNPHGLPMPPTPTALLVVAVVALGWAAGIFAMGYVAAAVGVGAVAALCAVLGIVKRNRARRSS